jgi:hypothetical protein
MLALALIGLLSTTRLALANPIVFLQFSHPVEVAQQLLGYSVPARFMPAGLSPTRREQQRRPNGAAVLMSFARGTALDGQMRFDIYENEKVARASLPGDERDQVFTSRLGWSDIKIDDDPGRCEVYLSRDRTRHAAHCAVRVGALIFNGLSVQPATADPWAPNSAGSLAQALVLGAYETFAGFPVKVKPTDDVSFGLKEERAGTSPQPNKPLVDLLPASSSREPDRPWQVDKYDASKISCVFGDWLYSFELKEALGNTTTLVFKGAAAVHDKLQPQKIPITGTLNIGGQSFSAQGTYVVDESVDARIPFEYSLVFAGSDAERLNARLHEPTQSMTFAVQGKTFAASPAGLSAALTQLETAYRTKHGALPRWTDSPPLRRIGAE